jgi:hypothetical protein
MKQTQRSAKWSNQWSRIVGILALALVSAFSLNLEVAQARVLHPASSTISILSQTQTVRYPSAMNFALQASDSTGTISSAHLIIDVPPEQVHHDITVPVTQPGSQITLNYAYDATNDYLPPFTPVTYHWVLEDSNQQNTLSGPDQQFDFEDTRFTWTHLSQNDITVYWYGLDNTFGQKLLNTAVSEATSIEQDLQGSLTIPIRVFAYQSSLDLRGGLPPNTPNWAGGVALVALHQALIVVSDLTGNPLQRDLPHELTHLIFHEIAGLNCGGCPLWFDEGMAVYHQIYHEPDMQALFDQTVRNNRLLPFNTLTERFPSDSTLAELAYAQSWNFVKYLYQQFGEPQIAKLVHALSSTNFDQAFPAIFGADVPHEESQWHVSLGLPPTLNTAPSATPGLEAGAQNPSPAATGNGDQLLAIGVLLVTLLLMGLLGVGYLKWRRRQVQAAVPGGAFPPSGFYQQGFGAPPVDFQPGVQNSWPQGGAAGPAAVTSTLPLPERLVQVRLSIAGLTANEQRLEAQQAQLQSQLARWREQERGAQATSGLQGQRSQLQNSLTNVQQQLVQIKLQKQQLQAEQQLAAALEPPSRQSKEVPFGPGAATHGLSGTGYPGAGRPTPEGAQAAPKRRVSQE